MRTRQRPRVLHVEHLDPRIVLDAAGLTTPEFFNAVPYRSQADTPQAFDLAPGCDACVRGLEDFEDGNLDPGLQITVGQVIPPDFGTGIPNLTDSVDGDDGVIDGTGHTGEGGSSWFTIETSLRITLPGLMQSAGVVWTDGSVDLTAVIFEAFDQTGASLGIVNGGDIADDSVMGTTAEDRFFGVTFGDGVATGITAISITNLGGGAGLEIDHIQWLNCSACCDGIDLELQKSVDKTVVSPGELVTWTLTIVNNGQTAQTEATGVVISDIIPPSVTLVDAMVPQNSTFETVLGVGVWSLLNPLGVGESSTLQLTTRINDNVVGGTVVRNTAEVVSHDQPDVDSSVSNDDGDQSEDDEDAASVIVSVLEQVIDLELTKRVDQALVNVGDLVTWTLSVMNNGANATGPATNVALADFLPSQVTLVSATPSGNGQFDIVVGVGLWTLLDPLEPGEVATLQLVTRVNSDVAPGSTIRNTAQVAGHDQRDVDSSPSNDDGDQSEDDEAAVQIRVADAIDLELVKRVAKSVVRSGELVEWEVVLTNTAAASAAATGVTVQVPPSAGLTFSGVAVPEGTRFADGIWTIDGPIGPGESRTLLVRTTVADGFDGSTLECSAEVLTADQRDLDSTPGNGITSEDDLSSASVLVFDKPLSISGFSYVDANGDGIRQADETPLEGVAIELMWTDTAGNPFRVTTVTGPDGAYRFSDLAPGNYMVIQTQPSQFLDGRDTIGNVGGSNDVNDKFSLTLIDTDAINYNFGERGLLPEHVTKGFFLVSNPVTEVQRVDVRDFATAPIALPATTAATDEVMSIFRRFLPRS